MANLYDKAGLVNIPVGYQDGFLYNIKPEDNTLGFRFNRDSAATRVNKEGLIEQVGYFGPELVQNGNFSELGPELVVNGDFATDSDWTKGAGWSIANGKLLGTLSNSTNAYQAKVLEAGKIYQITYEISNYSQGGVRFQFAGGGSTVSGTSNFSNGVFTEKLKATVNHTSVRFRSLTTGGGFTGSIDNVSVKQVDPNDYWTLGTGWSFGDGIATCNGSQTSGTFLQQTPITFTNGNTYKVVFTCTIQAGNLDARLQGGGTTVTGTSRTSSGTYTEYLVSTGNTSFRMRGNDDFIGSISNISVVEILGDKPRIDYTDSLTSPSFLLEPQSTNLITYSEDFIQPAWNKSNTSIQINTTTSPSGNFDGSTLTDNATSSIHRIRHAVSLSASTDYSLSVFAKKDTLSNIQLALVNTANSNTISKVFDLENGIIGEELSQGGTTVSDAKIENYGNGWFRCIIVGQLSSAPNQYQISLATKTTGNSATLSQVTYSGDGTGSVFLYGAQIEQLSYPTSYIPTAGSTATRAEETCNSAGSASTFNDSEGVLYAEIAALANDSVIEGVSISDGTINNRVVIFKWNTSNSMRGRVTSSGSNTLNQTFSVNDIKSFNKIAIKYKLNDFAIWLNGVEVFVDTSGLTPIGLDRLNINGATDASAFYGKVKGVYVFNEALTDDELQQLTGPEYNSFAALAAAYNYTVI